MASQKRFGSKLLFCAAGILSVANGSGIARAQSVYIGTLNGVFSTGTNWQGSVVPQSSPLTSLLFIGGSTNATTATNDVATLFQVNALIFASRATSPFTLASSGGRAFELTGTNPTIAQNGFGDVLVSSPLTLSANTTITGTGVGNLDISGVVSGAGGLTIAATAPSLGSQQIRLSGVNTFTGDIYLQSGNLVVNTPAALGTGTLRVSGGTLNFERNNTVTNAIQLDSTLTLVGSASPILGSTAIAAGTGGILVRSGGLRIESASTYTGATTVTYSNNAQNYTSVVPVLTLAGTDGSLLATSALNIGAGATLRLDNTSVANTNRLGDGAPVNFANATLELLGENGADAIAESVGAVSGSGQTAIRLKPYSETTGNVALTIASLTRTNRGTFVFSGDTNSGLGTFGQAPGATGAANIYVTQSLAGDLVGGDGTSLFNTPILPYAVADTSFSGDGTLLATVGTNGIQAVSGYSTNINTAASDRNVRITATSVAVTTPRPINALVIGTSTSGSTTLSATGSGSVTLGSGMLLVNNSATISAPLLFGGREANVWVNGSTAITSSLSGTNGLTKSGYGTLTLSADNSGLTGDLTINSGIVSFGAANHLPGTGDIRIVGGAPFGLSAPTGLTYTGTGAATIARPLVLGGKGATLSSTQTGGTLTLSGTISGDGGLTINNPSSFGVPGANTILSGTNTFTGPVILQSGDLTIASDANLGNAANALSLSGSSSGAQGLRLTGNWNTNRPIYFAGSTTVQTNAFDATLDGVLTGSSVTVKKIGSGTLTLTAESPATVPLTVSEGTLTLVGNGALRTSNYTADNGGTLLLDNTGTAQSDRIGDFAGVSLNRGTFAVRGNAGSSIAESIGQLTVSGTGQSVVTLTKIGATSVSVSSVGLSLQANSPLLFRGNALGTDTRVLLGSRTPGFMGGLVTADDSPTGTGTGFAYYDGAVGVRVARDSDFVPVGAGQSFTAVQNSASVSLPTTAFVRTVGAVSTGAAGQNNTVYGARIGAGSGLTIASGTTLTTTGGAVSFDGTGSISGGTLTAGTNPLAVRTTGTGAVIGSTLTGSGGLQVGGGGTLTVSDTGSTLTGGIGVANATLLVETSLVGSGTVTLGDGGQLGGSGTVGATVAQSGSVITPGSSIGTLSVASFTANPGMFFDIELGLNGASDQVLSSSSFNFSSGGVYTVRFFDGTANNALVSADVIGKEYRLARFASGNTNFSTMNPTFVAVGGEGNLQTSGTFSVITPGDGSSYLAYNATSFQPVPATPAWVSLPFGASIFGGCGWLNRLRALKKRKPAA